MATRSRSNQLLATLEVPELHDELHNAIATQQKAEADYTNAHLIYQRLAAVNTKAHPNLVAQQDLDTAEANDRTTFAAIAATRANVEKYQTLVAYTRITAPFDGVVTKRYADPGALIQAGTTSDTQSMPLVRVSDNYLLRLDFPVDQPYVKDVHVGDPIEVRVESLGGKTFTGTITRATLKVNEDTRTMMTEIEVPNPKLEIVPGMYCRVVLKVQRRPQALAIPIQAVPPGYGDTVYVVNDRDQIEERPVTLGLETPNEFEVTSGLKEGELVLVGSRSQVQPGQKVEPKLVGLTRRNNDMNYPLIPGTIGSAAQPGRLHAGQRHRNLRRAPAQRRIHRRRTALLLSASAADRRLRRHDQDSRLGTADGGQFLPPTH